MYIYSQFSYTYHLKKDEGYGSLIIGLLFPKSRSFFGYENYAIMNSYSRDWC